MYLDLLETCFLKALFGFVDGMESFNKLSVGISSVFAPTNVRVGEALTKVKKSSAALTDAVVDEAMVLMC